MINILKIEVFSNIELAGLFQPTRQVIVTLPKLPRHFPPVCALKPAKQETPNFGGKNVRDLPTGCHFLIIM
jgi:hypothetical protein